MIKLIGDNVKYKVTCSELDYRGYGVVKNLEKVGFIKNLLPGEEAYIKINFEKRNFFEGEVVELLSRSKHRSNYEDDLDNNSLIHLDSKLQLEFQKDITLQTFLRNGITNFKLEEIITDNRYFNYRNKALFFAKNIPFLTLGGYKEKSRDFKKIDELILAEPSINEILKELNEYYAKERVYYHDLSSVIIRSNYLNQVMVIFVTRSQKVIPDIVYKPLQNKGNVISIYQNYKDSEKRNTGEVSVLLSKNEYLIDTISGKEKYVLYPNSFFQINREVTKQTYMKISNYITKHDVAIDAFAGISSIGQFISDRANYVLSIEIDDDSVKAAKESISLNKIKNIEVIHGDFNKEFNKVKNKANALIIDPPRSGINERVINLINESGLEKIIYLSCNLRTLVRDLKLLTNYEVISVTPIKMFFQTVEMETLVYLEAKKWLRIFIKI